MMLVVFAVMMQGAVLNNADSTAAETPKPAHIVPAGTVIPVTLTSRISTKHAKEGDGIYAQTAVPIAVDGKIVIPAGSFVRGKVAHVKQPGRVKGRAELTFAFQSMTLTTGDSFDIFASLGGTGGSFERKGEDTVVRDKGNDNEEILTDSAKNAGTGAVVGGVYGGGVGGAAKGAAIGAAAGAAGSGLAALIKKGEPLILEPGTLIEIVLDRPIER